MNTMKAVRYERFGPPRSLEVKETDKPEIEPDQVLVAVRAASVNPLDWYFLVGRPYAMRPMLGLRAPKRNIPGADVAGRVEAVGSRVTRFSPGDEVYGGATGSFAEFVAVREKALAFKPKNLTFEQAAAVPVAGLTALQGLRDNAGVTPGQSVLINGAAGGVGTFAVQIAKALGAEVTAVCSTTNVEMVTAIGADHVVDYTRDDFTRQGIRYDVVIDNVGNRSLRDCRRALTADGTYVVVGGSKDGRFLGSMARAARAIIAFRFFSQRCKVFMADFDPDDLATLAEMIEAGQVTPVIDRTLPLDQAGEALHHLSLGHAKGKIILVP